MKKLYRIIGFSTALGLVLAKVGGALAQSPTVAPVTGGGATAGALPGAGTTDLTYLLFLGGVLLFVFGTLKLVLSFRD